MKYFIILFNFHICAKLQTPKEGGGDELIVTRVFECFQSHFERITWIFAYDGCHNFFEIYIFIFDIVDYGLVTKSLGARCTFEVVAKKMNVNIFTTKLGWILSPSFWGTKYLEATILYNDSQHNIPALQGWAIKEP